jgi:hypothetical protein
MKMKLFALLLLAGGSLFAESHWSIGIGIGVPYYAPPPPPPTVVYTPHCPGPEYTWVPGYYYPLGARFVWRAGFWSRPPYAGAYWVAPRYYEHRYYRGYWERRDRRWDRDDDERSDHHDRGLHRGWYRHHGDDQP